MSLALVLLASESRLEALLDWLDRQALAIAGFPLLATSELAGRIRSDPRTARLPVIAPEALAEGGDIQVAARLLAGEVAAVIAFLDPEAPPGSAPDSRLLIRACDLANVPLALNAATAKLALRGLAHGRSAYLLFNPVAGKGDANADLALNRSILEPQLLVTVLLTSASTDPGNQCRELVELLQARPPSDVGNVMIVACGGDGTVSAVAGTGIPHRRHSPRHGQRLRVGAVNSHRHGGRLRDDPGRPHPHGGRRPLQRPADDPAGRGRLCGRNGGSSHPRAQDDARPACLRARRRPAAGEPADIPGPRRD
jgi:methylglyoxal synthase